MEDLAFQHNAMHDSAQRLQQLAENCLSTHTTQWQQIQNGIATFPSEMYEANSMCSEHWQNYTQNLYQYHQTLSQHIDNAATDLHALDNDVSSSFTDIIDQPGFGLFP